MRTIFLNGPVQNGDFTFVNRPGKAVGIRLAAALNAILGNPPAPHLWNTVTLAGDLRHRQRHTGQPPPSRSDAEATLIAAKYQQEESPLGGIVTDADPEVAQLALEMTEQRLRSGALAIDAVRVYRCSTCGHMTGSSGHPCRACGGVDTRLHTELQLTVSGTAASQVIDRQDIHASRRKPPKHLQHTARDVADHLILSRTRDHGIDLSPLGLPGLVLDPRVGLHITALAAARQFQAETAVMTITENAAGNVAAYGQQFRSHGPTRIVYALHGRIPYERVAEIHDAYAAYDANSSTRVTFETWFLPLAALNEKIAIGAQQLRPLFKHFMRAGMAKPAVPAHDVLDTVREAVASGRTDWVMNKIKLAHAMSAAGFD